MPDDFDSAMADRCSAVDDVSVPADLWSRVQFKVLDRLPIQFTEEETTMIHVETPSHTDEHKRPKRVLIAVLLAAAAVVAIAIVTIRNEPVSPTDQPSPTVTVPPRALFGTPLEHFVPGTYYIDEVEGTATPRIFVTLGDGWTNFGDKIIGIDGGGDARFGRADRVYADACHASEGFHPGPVTTLDGLVTALTEQQGWADVTTPTDVTVSGYAGKRFQRTAPADKTGCNTNDAPFRSWETDGGAVDYWWYQPRDTESLLVLDVNGTIIIINTVTSDLRENPATAPLTDMLDSIRIEQA